MIRLATILFMLAAVLRADQSVTLAWDPSTDPEVTGAIVYYGNASRNYPYHTNVGNVTRATVNGLQAGLTYYFAVTATNSAGLESDYSNEVSAYIPTDLTNSFPTIKSVGDIVLWETQTTNTTVEIWDVETNPKDLLLIGSSTNQSVLPVSGIILGGTNHIRTVKLMPVKAGKSLVTLAVSDGAKASSTSFLLTVLPLPTPPIRVFFRSDLQISSSPTGPWTNILTTILPVDISMDTNNFYRIWND